jgi:N12 class adenine-specific DNA methylase/superfamily I DNA/RNA helicase
MGRYGGWGAADGVFAPGASGNDLRDRERLRAVLARLGGSTEAGERLFRAAGLTVLNAHYTDPVLVRAIYRALADLGLEQGTIVEPGVGAGQFAAFAPGGIRITGIELDPATALIAQLLHPDAEILAGSVSGPRFARVRDQSASPVRVPRDTADGFAGNVPFSDVKWPDEVLNPGSRFPLHDHAIMWGVTRVTPGGLCAFITSRYTADKQNPGFRRTLAGELDLIGMVRLPSAAHKRMAGTQVVTDIIIGRRLADGERPVTDPGTWEQGRPLPLPGSDLTALVNTYFHDNPQHVLGTLKAGGMHRAGDFSVVPSGDLEQQLGAALSEIAGRAQAAGQRFAPSPAARPVIEILSRRPDGTVTANTDGTFTQVIHGQDEPLAISSPREASQTRTLAALAEARAALIRAEAGCPEDTGETDALRARMGELYDAYTGAYGAIGRFTVRTTNYHVKTLKGVLDRLDFSKADVPDPEVMLLEAYLGRDALTLIVTSAADPGHVRHGTRKDKQGNVVATETRLVQVARVRAALTAALAQIPQGADAERLTAAFGERMSRIETGEQRTRLMPVAFRSDPRRPAVEALENFDPVTQTATRKPVFSRRTAVPRRLELGADTPEEALDLVLIHRRRVDLGEIARLLGTDEASARKQLGTLVFDDPAGGSLVAAGEYLSGDVHEKLTRARTAAAADPGRYTVNVESLQAVQPPALAAEDIQARLGSAWLSRQIVQDGLRHILEDPTLTVTHPGGAGWTVSTRKGRNSNAQDRYGTSDWNAIDLAQALLTNASIAVYRSYIDPATGNEKKYRDDPATLFSYRKAQRLDADFVSWLWSDPDRADECVRLYNAAYNNQVKRKWDSAPFYIPGLAPGIRLHPFQNAMARRLHTDSGLAAWVVGAGKTELGIVAAMEGNRLGRHQLAAIVCPASLVSQWSNRIYSTCPQAQVLVADDDLRARKDAREIFTERAASGDYQLAVTPYEFFGSLPLSADAARASADEEIDKLTRYAEEAAAQGDRHTAKTLQGQIARIEAQYSAAAQGVGGAVTFTDARIDSVIVDEWHNFRRITRDSNNRAMAIIKGSDRADHMLAVFDYLRKRHPEGLLLGLSGTPLEQSIADAWAAMRFFAPERLKELGLEEFDAFLTTFGRTEARREPTPTGSGLHVRERASDWFNLPEMRRALWDPFADVVRSADLGLNVPRLTGGRPQTHVLPQTPGQASTQADIDEGYARFKAGSRGPDNHILRLMDRAAKNALHPRMLGMETDGKIKLEVWAEDAAAWYHATKDTRFLDREGNPHPVPGALRMVACELGVPDPARPNAWSVYSEMRSLLAARGVPAGAVRFAQDAAGSDRKKAALWEDARTGRCNFVIGSAQTAGTGVDVPDRLQVLDYMTLSWNPTQFEQWLGRIVRQGNQNPEVAANVWATEGTIEVLRADKIAMKSAPFEALLDGTSETRRVNEKTYDPLSAWAADMATRMSGNPLLNAQREAQLEVDTAQGMQNEWQRENGVKARRIAVMNKEIQELEERNAAIDGALSRAVDTRGGKFKAQAGTVRYTVRAEAGTALITALAATAAGDVSALADGNPQHLGELAGFPVTARYRRFTLDPPAQAEDRQDDGPDPEPAERTMITLGLEGVPNGQVPAIEAGDLPGRDPAALITSLEDRIRRLPGARDANTAAITENRDQIARTKTELARPSPYLQPLADARDALDRIEAEIDQQLKDATAEPDAAVPEGAEPVPVPPGEPAADDSPEPAASAAAGDIASLPPWTAASPHSAAITAACQAALADSSLTQVARVNDLDRFLEWLSGSGWAPGYAAAAIGDDSQIPPFARAILEDPVFAEDLTCAVGTAVHARCTGQAPPPGSAARRPVPPRVELSALAHWQENDEATGRAAAGEQRHDLVTAAQIDIWLSRAGLPRQGRHVRSDPGGHAVLELTAAGGEQWRLTVPRPEDAQHEATARYSLTRSGRDGWTSLLNGTPGSTTPEQAAALLAGTLTEEGALPLPPATPAPDQAVPGAAQAGQPAGLSHAPAPPAGDPLEGTPAPAAEDGEEDQAAGTAGWPPGHPYTGQRDALVAAFHSAHDGPPAAMRGAAQARDRQNFQVAFTIWGRRRLEATAVAAISDAVANSAPPPAWARAVDGDPALAATLVAAAAAGVWRDLMAAADAAEAPGPAANAGPQPGAPSPGARPAGTGAGAAPAPAAPGASHAGQAASGSGMSREDLDFACQHAYDFVIGTVRDPGFAQEERALDYAAWYMATFGGEESLDELPGHDHAWGWFADRGYPARDLAATPGGQRDQGRPGMEATAEAAGPPGHAGTEPAPGETRPDQAASADGQLPAAAPHPAAGIPGPDPGTTPGPVHGGPAGHPLAGTGAGPSPAAARELVPPVTVLHGHVSEDTAAEVPGYPYGSLRCTMRYWLETDRRGQVRRVHQTTNPKRPGEPRNKPHRDTYSSWAVLYRAANGHVELHATGYWGPSPALDARIRLDGTYDQLDDDERAAYDKHVARSLNGNTRGWEDWRADLAGIRGHLAEHGTLPDPGQMAQARGHRLHEADAVAAVAAVAGGLGGNHAGPPAPPGQPGTTAPDPAAEASVLTPRSAAAPVPEPTGPLAAQTPPAHAAPEPPAAPGSAAGLRQLAAGHGLAADTARTGGTLTVTVHDQGRTILLHDDISGTTAGGVRLDPAEVPAYLGAYARHPQLPPRCLLDLARHEPAEPAPLTLTAARETAARHGLEVRVRRAGGQSYITFCEPGSAAETPGDITIPALPVLSYPAGSASARHGPCTVPVAAIGSYLAAYRDNVPPAMFTGPEQHDWRRRVAPLTPHLIDGSGHFIPAARDRLRAALAAARDDRAAEASTLLAEAEALTPVTLVPEREAELAAVLRRDTARYRHAEDPAASLAATTLQTLDVTARELDWVRAYIAGHPEIREHAEETGPAAGSDRDREAATGLAQQTQQASDRGDYQRALALIDEIELLRPRGSYETARNHVRAAMSTAARANPQPQRQSRASGDHAEAGATAPAAGPPAADSPPAGPVSGTDTDGTAVASPAAVPGPDAERRQAGGTAPEPVPAAAAEPEAASPGAGRPADAAGTAAPAGPGQAGRYTGRIRISTGSGPPTVSGTSFDDPADLREALRANFTWHKRRQLWEYTGRRDGPLEAAEAVRQVLARLDRDSAAPAAEKFPPTQQQQAILDAFRDGKDIAVQALAGTGKTTTLVLLARALLDRSPQARIVYTAFNASIVADARRGRFGRNVTASTMHSLAWQALLQTSYAAKIEHADKGARWPEQWAGVLGIPEATAAGTRDGAVPADAAEIARLVIATVRKFRESADGEPGRQHLPYLAGPAGSPLSRTVLSYARKAWADISDAGNARLLAAGQALRVEHDDYLKIWALSRPQINAEVIFFDEAQDVNDVMRRVILDQPAQTVVVGDSHQSIYSFRGAIDALKDWPADIVLPLTQSWRFGPDAAAFGNLFLRSLDSKLLLEGNPARDTRLGSAAEPDAILCRTNATAVAEVFAGLESGKRTALAGGGQAIREIAKAARDLQAGKGTKHPDLSRFADWDEVRHYAQHQEDGKSLQVFVRLIDRHGPGGLIDMIGRLTPEGDTSNPPQLTISTAHKAKGLEWDVVRVAGDFRGPVTDPGTGEVTWPAPEERRLAYVAATRARKLLEPGSLNWINDYPLPGAQPTQGPAQGKDSTAQAAAPSAARIQPDITQTGQEQDLATQDSQDPAHAGPGHDLTAGASEQQNAPVPAEAQASARANAGEQAAGAGEPDARQQSLAENNEAEPQPGSPDEDPAVSQQAADADGDHPSSPDGPEEPGAGQAPGGPPGLTQADRESAYQHARDHALGSSHDPGPEREERAQDYATWYLAAYSDRESIADLPGHHQAWEQFAGQGYPAREPAATAEQQRDQDQPATGAGATPARAVPASIQAAGPDPRETATPGDAQPAAATATAVAATRARQLLETGSLSWIYDYPLTSPEDTAPPGQARQPRAAGTRPGAEASPEPDGTAMRFMNDTDIQDAARRWMHHPVLGPATRTLENLMTWADANSDGWAHWPAPARAASRLMELIERDGTYTYRADTDRADATPAALKAACAPVRAFRTRHKADFAIEEPGSTRAEAGQSRHTRQRGEHADAARDVGGREPAAEPGQEPATAPGTSPLTNSDLAARLRLLQGFAGWLSRTALPSAGPPEPGADGLISSADCDERGMQITVTGPGTARNATVTWEHAASWIDNGVTPARLGVIITADRLLSFWRSHRDQLIAADTSDPDDTAGELAQIRDSAIAMVVGAALRSRGAAAPVPPPRPGDPAWYTARMITRPERGAGKAENAALERLLRLREIIREPQPATPAGIRAEIRHWTGGHGLADLVRALDSPAAMRTWISEQASRAGAGSYDSSGDCWHGATADGLISDRRGDDRAPALTRWDEIPAWIQPGITGSLRDSLLAADGASSTLSHRRLTAAIHPGASHTAPTQEEEDRARRLHDKAIAAAWAAIDAAPPPAAADLERARHLYRDTGPVQDSLFGDPPEQGTHTQDHPGNTAANRPVTQPQPGQAHPRADQAGLSPEPALPAPGEEDQQEPGTDRPVIQDAGTPGHAATAGPVPATAPAASQAGPADGDDPEPPQMPPNNSDLAIALGMSPYNLNRFLTEGETTHAHGGSGGWRSKGRPDAGVSEHIYRDRRGIERSPAGSMPGSPRPGSASSSPPAAPGCTRTPAASS